MLQSQKNTNGSTQPIFLDSVRGLDTFDAEQEIVVNKHNPKQNGTGWWINYEEVKHARTIGEWIHCQSWMSGRRKYTARSRLWLNALRSGDVQIVHH